MAFFTCLRFLLFPTTLGGCLWEISAMDWGFGPTLGDLDPDSPFLYLLVLKEIGSSTPCLALPRTTSAFPSVLLLSEQSSHRRLLPPCSCTISPIPIMAVWSTWENLFPFELAGELPGEEKDCLDWSLFLGMEIWHFKDLLLFTPRPLVALGFEPCIAFSIVPSLYTVLFISSLSDLGRSWQSSISHSTSASLPHRYCFVRFSRAGVKLGPAGSS